MAIPKYLGSSIDETKLSTTIKGIVPFLAILATALKLDITEADLSNIGDLLVVAIISVSGAVTGLTALYGAVRRIVVEKLKKEGKIVPVEKLKEEEHEQTN